MSISPRAHTVQGVQEKLCFFTIHCVPSLAYIAVRGSQSSQRNASVQSYWLIIFVQTIAVECWRGRGGKLSRIFGKNTIFDEHPVCATSPIHDSLHEQFQTSIQITGLFFQSGKFALFAKICIHLHTHMQYYLLAIPPPPQGCKWSK